MNALLPLFHHRCDIFEIKQETSEFGCMSEKKKLQEENIPCRLRYLSQSPTYATPPIVKANAKLYLPPDYHIKPGSHIIVYLTKGERFYQTGIESHYETHNEVLLALEEKWV